MQGLKYLIKSVLASQFTWWRRWLASTAAALKHVVGLREGSTENAAACKTLLADPIERGLPTERTVLFVIDGARALHKAVTGTFGKWSCPVSVDGVALAVKAGFDESCSENSP